MGLAVGKGNRQPAVYVRRALRSIPLLAVLFLPLLISLPVAAGPAVDHILLASLEMQVLTFPAQGLSNKELSAVCGKGEAGAPMDTGIQTAVILWDEPGKSSGSSSYTQSVGMNNRSSNSISLGR